MRKETICASGNKHIESCATLTGHWKGAESMANSIFNENMTSSQARFAFFKAVDGKSKEEIEKLKNTYFEIMDVIMEREFKLADKGWMLN